MTRIERMVLGFERPPWNAVWRCLLGFLLMATYHGWLIDGRAQVRVLIAWLLGTLVALRVVPGVLRRILPLSESVQAQWRHERELARMYDSYQWRKLFWIGSGMAAYCVYSANAQPEPMSVALGSLVGGGIGLVRWRRILRYRGCTERMTS